jgi:hypothetical protein
LYRPFNSYRHYSNGQSDEQTTAQTIKIESSANSPEEIYRKYVAYWIFIVAGMIFIMVSTITFVSFIYFQ